MARRKHRLRYRKTGARLLLLGSGLVLIPTLVEASDPVLGPLVRALRTPGWISVAAGALVLSLHFLPRHGTHRRGRNQVAIWEESPQEHAFLPRPMVAGADPLVPPTEWGPRVLELIEWRRFQAVCETLFTQAGFQIRHDARGTDGTTALWLHAAGLHEPVAVVQCKHWRHRPIPADRVRAFLGTMAAHDVTRGTFVTSSTFTAEALVLGRANRINLQDGAGLLRLIATRTPEQQTALLALALEGEFWRPSCPNCRIKLAERAAPRGGGRLWGCPNYPRCRFALPMTGTEAAFLDAPGVGATRAEPPGACGAA